MSDDEVAAYLEEQKVLNVATIGPSGHPHVVAMWYVVLDGKPAFWTFGKSQKVMNIRRDPKITGLVESGEPTTSCAASSSSARPACSRTTTRSSTSACAWPTKYQGPPSDAALPFIETQARSASAS